LTAGEAHDKLAANYLAFVQLAAIRLWLRVIINRVFLFLRFELLDERSDMRGDGGRKSVVLELEAAPN
jgi:hypothetical protein